MESDIQLKSHNFLQQGWHRMLNNIMYKQFGYIQWFYAWKMILWFQIIFSLENNAISHFLLKMLSNKKIIEWEKKTIFSTDIPLILKCCVHVWLLYAEYRLVMMDQKKKEIKEGFSTLNQEIICQMYQWNVDFVVSSHLMIPKRSSHHFISSEYEKSYFIGIWRIYSL